MTAERDRAVLARERRALTLAKRAARLGWLRSGRRLDRDELESRCTLTAANSLRNFRGDGGEFFPFLQQRLNWAVADGVRAQKRTAERFIPWSHLDDGDPTPLEKACAQAWVSASGFADSDTPERTSRRRRTERIVDYTLNCLDERSRNLLIGHYRHGRPFNTMIRWQGVTATQGCRIHHKALWRMRDELARCGIATLSATEI